MTPEQYRPKRPYEIFDITEDELSRWRVSDEKLKQILANPNTSINEVILSSNSYGEFIFLTTSRGIGEQRVCMTFYGYGYHEYRERWIHKEWFWRQTSVEFDKPLKQIDFKEVEKIMENRLADISTYNDEGTQTEVGRMFETLADMTDDDAALAEMQDLGLL